MKVLKKPEVEINDREVIISRVFNSPAELVYQAWTDPKQITKWFGPNGFTVPVCEIDLRKGGAYRIVMRGPDGIDYPIKGVYHDVIENKKIIYTVNLEEHPKQWKDTLDLNLTNKGDPKSLESVTTVNFESEQKNKTKLVI